MSLQLLPFFGTNYGHSWRAGHGRQETRYQWSAQRRRGGNTIGYAAARPPFVTPDGTDGVRTDHSSLKKKMVWSYIYS